LCSASVPAPAADMVHALLLLFFRLPFHALGNAEQVIIENGEQAVGFRYR
jgi:hypothetical protein